MIVNTLKGVVVINYRLKVKTGLHIGGAKETFEIGGVDSPVIKLPTKLNLGGKEIPKDSPYIPGSSLKGKIRSLMEWSIEEPKGVEGEEKTSVEYMIKKAIKEKVEKEYKISQELIDFLKSLGIFTDEELGNLNFQGNKDFSEKDIKSFTDTIRNIGGRPCDCGTCSICKLFGVSNVKVLEKLPLDKLPGPSRVEFSDIYLTQESIEELQKTLGEGIFTEIKYENTINRLTGTVKQGGLRNQERVPAGAEFEGEITVDIYSEGDIELLEKLLTGLKLLENSYLGGSGSRGYGKVVFTEVTITFRGRDYFEGKGEEKKIVKVQSLDEIDFGTVKSEIQKALNS